MGFTRARASGTQDRDATIKITSLNHDTHDQDIANGIDATIHKGGQNTPTADLPMGAFKHTNVAAATALTDYARVQEVQNNSYRYGADTGAANAYAITLTPAPTAYAKGQTFLFLAANANTGASTLDVNGLGTKTIKTISGADLSANAIVANKIYTVTYDGTNFQIFQPSVGGGGGGTTVAVEDDNVSVSTSVDTLNFGTNLAVVDDGSGQVTITASVGSSSTGEGVLTDVTVGSNPVTEGDSSSNATTNTTNFNNMLVEGGTFRFPPGIFWFDTIDIDVPVMILGSGENATILKCNSQTTDFIENHGDDSGTAKRDQSVIADMTLLYGNGTPQTAGKAGVLSRAPLFMQNVEIEGFSVGLKLDGITLFESAAENTFINVKTQSNTSHGIEIDASTIQPRYCTFIACRTELNGGKGMYVHGNNAGTATTGLGITNMVFSTNTGIGFDLDEAFWRRHGWHQRFFE